ncbi:MAG: hypothetical protein J6S87_04315 [Bacteroidales bacterium]|nr:hypothetical protein [Bacteroidales bacterium]
MVQKEKFMIFRRNAKMSCEDTKKCVTWFCFTKRNDGTYEAELDESWTEGSHYGGGTIDRDIPADWFDLSYDEFLERVITLASASKYGFTVDDLKEKNGLKEFFGFE